MPSYKKHCFYFSLQDVQISKEHQRVQPRSTSISSRGSISTMSRGSLKSDPTVCNEDTSSISARSDTSVDSYVFDVSFGKFFLSNFWIEQAVTITEDVAISHCFHIQ